MKHLVRTLKLMTVWSLLALLFIDPLRPDCWLIAPGQRLTIRDFRANKNFWTSSQAEALVSAKQLGHLPQKAIVPLIFSPQGKWLSAREYNSRNFGHLRWFYTDLETFRRVTRERTASPAYAKVLTEHCGAPLYAYDPYALSQQTREDEARAIREALNEPLTDFARLEEKSLGFSEGDILIRPNMVIWSLFGSTSAPPDAPGSGWGHAVGISCTSKPGADISTSLEQVHIIEAWSWEVPLGYQIRETQACVPGKFEIGSRRFPTPNDSYWCKKRKGSRFRLRMKTTEQQQKAIVDFWRQQVAEMDAYSPFAKKRFPCTPTTGSGGCNRTCLSACSADEWANGDRWYCTLLVWQAYYYATGIDIDLNGGAYVFPNDIIRSPVFNNTVTDSERRVRF